MAELCPCRELYLKQISSTLTNRLTSLERSVIFAIYLEELVNSVDGLDLVAEKKEISLDLNEKWNILWSGIGYKLVLRTWLLKYKDYIDSNYTHVSKESLNALHTSEEIKNDKQSKTTVTNLDVESCYCGLIELDKILISMDINSENQLEIDNDNNVFINDWNTLWEKHYNDQYKLNFAIFSEILASLSEFSEITVKDRHLSCLSQQLCSDYITIDCNAELRSFGLPTSFGKRRKLSSNLNFRQCKGNSDDEHISNNNVEEDVSSYDNERVQSLTTCSSENSPNGSNLIPPEIKKSKTLFKYWKKRFTLFSRFDEGIKLDEESWFSVTPEKIAKNIAEQLKCQILVDAFCGSGGNTIQFALTCDKVIAIDIDPIKISFAKHNAKIYGVEHKIDFILGDFLNIYRRLNADVVFLSPPWGGPSYIKNHSYDVEEDLLPVPASKLLEICRKITPDICMYLPRNTDIQKLLKTVGKGNSLKVEKNFLDKKAVALSVYYGNLIR